MTTTTTTPPDADPAARPALIRMAMALAWESCYDARLLDDLRGAALLALVRAARDWDESVGMPLRAYAERRVRGAIIDEARRLTGRHRLGKVWQAVPHAALDGHEPTSGDLPVGWEAEAEDEVQAMARRLPPRHAAMVRLVHLHAGTSQRQAGATLGVGKTMACHLYNDAMAILAGGKGRQASQDAPGGVSRGAGGRMGGQGPGCPPGGRQGA